MLKFADTRRFFYPQDMLSKYEPVIGLEVHARLLTQSKLFSSEPNSFGHEPNVNVSPVSLGHPGTLPFLNEKVIDDAILLGLACGSAIAPKMYFERKNYFYPDLPKGYQISQLQTPVCVGGSVSIACENGTRAIKLNRIHIEEDAGKSIHDMDARHSLLDLNRAGTPLLEIVTEPDLFSADEAWRFLSELRQLVRFLEICDGNMEEGSLRCDANISLRLKGEKKLGTKVEVKNVNSLRFLKKAIEFEIGRQAEALESGATITQHTRSFDAEKGITFAMRYKEIADDYRYFPDPDLPPVFIAAEKIEHLKAELPETPFLLRQRWTNEHGLAENEALILADDKTTAAYFEKLSALAGDGKTAANWMLGAVKTRLNERALTMRQFPLKADALAALIALVQNGTVSHSSAATKIFDEMLQHPDEAPEAIARRLNLVQQSDVTLINSYIEQVVKQHPDKVKAFKNGKKGLAGFFMGEVMKLSGGKLDPQQTNQLILEALNKK